MSKYSPLSDHFASLTQDTWRATFTDIELLLGSTLPKAARQPAWWIGEGKTHQSAWLDHDWRVSAVGDGVVTFRRARAHDIQPQVLKTAAESASTQAHVRQNAGVALVAGAAVAAVAGLGVLTAKLLRGRKDA